MSETELEVLLVVQDIDLSLDQHRHRRANLPEAAEMASIDAAVAGLEAQIGTTAVARDRIAAVQDAAEKELAATEQRSKMVSQRLYGGEVSASRELQAMAADLESLKARASHLEDQALGCIEERDPLEARLAGLEAQVGELGDRKVELASVVAGLQAEIDAQIAELSARRAAAAGRVPAGLLGTYEKIRARSGGIGAARLVGNHCDGCHLVLSSMELDHVRHLPPGEVVTCEQCARILVPPARTS